MKEKDYFDAIVYFMMPFAIAIMFGMADATFARPQMGDWALMLAGIYMCIVGFQGVGSKKE